MKAAAQLADGYGVRWVLSAVEEVAVVLMSTMNGAVIG